jgi:hypothetical protein
MRAFESAAPQADVDNHHAVVVDELHGVDPCANKAQQSIE